jgi:hypothetical protein
MVPEVQEARAGQGNFNPRVRAIRHLMVTILPSRNIIHTDTLSSFPIMEAKGVEGVEVVEWEVKVVDGINANNIF